VDASYWRELIKPVVAGRKIVLTCNPVNAQKVTVDELRELGATEVFVLGDGMGTGPTPDCDWFALDVRGDTVMDAIRAGQAMLRALPADAVTALDTFDPRREALVIGTFLNEVPEVAGRRSLSWRWPAWLALEDKTVVDALWDAIGVPRAPSRVVAVHGLEPRVGEVVAGDAREGFHGGAELTRWVRTESDAEPVLQLMRRHCDTVRVMPFLEGIPCSIHGIVFPDFVVALRPVEMTCLRRGGEFFYAGAATYWDPPEADRDEMRAIARRVGEHLRAAHDFRGAFTVDGVMTEDGFRPTELNPRMGAGLGVMARGAPQLPIDLVNQSLIAGRDLDYRPHDFERVLVDVADACRAGGTWRALTDAGAQRMKNQPIVWEGDAWRRPVDGEPADGWVDVGDSNLGCLVRLRLDPARTPAGPSIGPRAAAFYAFCDSEVGTDVGPLESAMDARM
jgi:hypothetical protein